MNGNGFWFIVVAALAAYMGTSWERARKAGDDARLVRQRVSRLRATATKERLHALLIAAGALAVIMLIARGG
ncbi:MULTISPECIES: hypothetical protein [Thermomonosporaceae]|uniref:hypothetical protein n=1 Tax=Thermomonosporaceae TaxID=2012 RepID=UPI003454C0D4